MCNFTGNDHSELAAGNCRIFFRTFAHQTVKVQSPFGLPMHPCHPARARELIRRKRAVRVCRHPYTIRLKTEHLADSLNLLAAPLSIEEQS